ncbi:hypothetical protein CC86DRAFT_119277 [Ophiobolus disseminans]|uniref:Uncharacterized protein n=1 Tax=Ophiobolus disseminans TaxID=1469910 RepID=A0A6A6ZGQ2_9PLEO|nr:hypothetical protein CC86DRAFT_119277 [Ophiobolus disseminans]
MKGSEYLDENGADTASSTEANELEDLATRRPFVKTRDDVSNWMEHIERVPAGEEQEVHVNLAEEMPLPQIASYEHFIPKSYAYRWLLSNLRAESLLSRPNPNVKKIIGSKVLETLQLQAALRKVSRRKATPATQLTFNMHWDLREFISHLGISLDQDMWKKIVCLTGSTYQVQATTVADYLRQMWPTSEKYILKLLLGLLRVAQGQRYIYSPPELLGIEFSARFMPLGYCSISVTGGPYLLSEVAEQIAWLTVTMRLLPQDEAILEIRPRMESLSVSSAPNERYKAVIGTCQISYDLRHDTEPSVHTNGSCWTPLFAKAVLVCGYPIPKRPVALAGLETSLDIMASIIRTNQVARLEDRVIMKGFNTLLVATEVQSDFIMWHALVSRTADERISFFDPRIEELKIRPESMPLLRALENTRHIIGWCSQVTDFCGHPGADLKISTSGVLPSPASIHVDRLYIEGGMHVIGGMSMRLNQKEQPTELRRDSDYPSLLAWIATQFVTFHDVDDCRAWLVDGASALLHLVRISLYLDETNTESTYDWVFDMNKLKDHWPGCSGRVAAKNTLKNWDNLALPVYVKSQSVHEGEPVKIFSTFGERVSKILHSLELLVDRQVHMIAQDGITTPQTFDRRKGNLGFDILDILTPRGPISSRTARFDTWGDGWIDFLPAIGVVSIFGNGFGDLIRPMDPKAVCVEWQTIPKGSDFLIASISTLRLLHEVQLQRLIPDLRIGQLTDKLSWSSPHPPFDFCKCSKRDLVSRKGNCNPVQFMVSKSSLRTLMLKDSTPVDLMSLEVTGAVVFANLSSLGQRKHTKKPNKSENRLSVPLSSSASNSGTSSLAASTSASTTAQSSASTDLTVPIVTSTDSANEPEQIEDKRKPSRLKEKWASLSLSRK